MPEHEDGGRTALLTMGLAGSTLALALGLTTAPVSSYVCHVMLAVQTRWEDSHTRGEGWHVAQHNTIEDDRLPTND